MTTNQVLANESSQVDDPHSTSAGEMSTHGGCPEAPDDTREAQPRPPGPRYKSLVTVSLVLVLLAAGTPYGIEQWQYYHIHESTDDAYVVGNINPISAQVGGTVLTVHIENHQRVEAGQVLAQLDPQDFESQVRQAEAEVAMAEADLNRAKMAVEWERQSGASEAAQTRAAVQEAQSQVEESQHDIEESQAFLRMQEAAVAVAQADTDSQQALLELARMDDERLQALLNDGVVARQLVDEAGARLRAAQAVLRASQRKHTKAERELTRAQIVLRTRQQARLQAIARLAGAEAVASQQQANEQKIDMKQAQVQIRQAQLKQKQVALAQAHVQLAQTTLRAPTSGVIAKSNLEVGQVVQSGQPLLAIVPLHDVWVEANYKETQLHRMQAGQAVRLEVDAYPGQVFTGTVESISPGTGSAFSLLPPENATGNFVKVVQRVPVKIALTPQPLEGAILRPGMSVVATIDLRS